MDHNGDFRLLLFEHRIVGKTFGAIGRAAPRRACRVALWSGKLSLSSRHRARAFRHLEASRVRVCVCVGGRALKFLAVHHGEKN